MILLSLVNILKISLTWLSWMSAIEEVQMMRVRREILEYFSPAVQLGLTATPKRDDNVDTYAYFGEPVYTYSLKDGISDGFLTHSEFARSQLRLTIMFTQPTTQFSKAKSRKGKNTLRRNSLVVSSRYKLE